MRLKTILKVILATAVAVYVVGVGALFVTQRALLYLPQIRPGAAQAQTQSGVDGLVLATFAGPQTLLHVWTHDGDADKQTIVYFHGNAASMTASTWRLQRLADAGYSIRALEYRGFGGAPGTPTQDGLTADAVALIDRLVKGGLPASRIVLYGWSLGSAVAMQAAAQRPVGALMLEAPPAAIDDIAADRYPFVPVRLLMLDPWRSIDVAGEITAPVLVLHGRQDTTVPFSHGQRLAAALPNARLVAFDDGRHANLVRIGGMEAMLEFLGKLPR